MNWLILDAFVLLLLWSLGLTTNIGGAVIHLLPLVAAGAIVLHLRHRRRERTGPEGSGPSQTPG